MPLIDRVLWEIFAPHLEAIRKEHAAAADHSAGAASATEAPLPAADATPSHPTMTTDPADLSPDRTLN
ncbi:hypothetical protein ACO2Q3_13775 [Caulobacter sp. KR2-114]|uniref:hypothetical protein n=1 Tax=Caulobacter sp. KR2-114 TaxID=3400912 RepID=UPI003C1000A5